MVALFGTGDKVALFVLMTRARRSRSAPAPVSSNARRPPFGALVFAVGGVLSLLAVSTRSGSGHARRRPDGPRRRAPR